VQIQFVTPRYRQRLASIICRPENFFRKIIKVLHVFADLPVNAGDLLPGLNDQKVKIRGAHHGTRSKHKRSISFVTETFDGISSGDGDSHGASLVW
jgi:hypothetical protein